MTGKNEKEIYIYIYRILSNYAYASVISVCMYESSEIHFII